MNITIRQLEILVTLGETLSFTKASEILDVTQPSVSEAIKRIEKELGIVLFNRTTRTLTLSPEGEHTVAIAREILNNYRHGIKAIQERAEEHARRLVIATLPSITVSLLPPALKKLNKLFPRIEISVHDVQHDVAIQMLEDGIAHVALTVNAVNDDMFEFRHIGYDPMLLICDETHPLLTQKAVPAWDQLVAYPLVTLSKDSSVRLMTESAFMQHGLACSPAYEVRQIPSAIALVEAGLAISVLPALTLPMARTTGVRTRAIAPGVQRESGAVLLRKSPQRAEVAALIKILQSNAIPDPVNMQ